MLLGPKAVKEELSQLEGEYPLRAVGSTSELEAVGRPDLISALNGQPTHPLVHNEFTSAA